MLSARIRGDDRKEHRDDRRGRAEGNAPGHVRRKQLADGPVFVGNGKLADRPFSCGCHFLGKSGTGKSTHARLWLQYNEGSTLLNDDNPVVRLFKGEDGKISTKVYGSPWSGKTPCYRNEVVDVGGFILLSQAPFNKISRLKGVAAYAALVPCISGMRWDKEIANGIHQTENALASNVPVWYLECLPDEAAAKLCQETIA